MSKTTTLKPRLSEQAYAMSQAGVYIFEVPTDVNKHTVSRAVAAQFEVEVTNVNITNIPGKAKRSVRKGGRQVKGRTSDMRKAYVTLKKGQTLPIFAAEAEAEVKEAKAAEKAAKKEKK
jgi:large subunit ribosomal protein L23